MVNYKFTSFQQHSELIYFLFFAYFGIKAPLNRHIIFIRHTQASIQWLLLDI